MATTEATPRDIGSFRREVEARYEGLSDRLQRVARHVLDEPHDLAFETLAVIAERSRVQPSTIVRFAQAFGFTGATQMQRMLRDALLRETGALGYAERVREFQSARGAGAESGTLLDQFVEGSRLALENLGQSVRADEIERAVTAIASAGTVYVAGFRRAFPVASYLAYLLSQADKRTVLVDGIAGLQGQQVRGAQPGDLVVAISFNPYSAEVGEIAEAGAARGATVMAITDSLVAPVARPAALVFQVREAEVGGFRSLSASMCLAQTIAIAFASRPIAKPHRPRIR